MTILLQPWRLSVCRVEPGLAVLAPSDSFGAVVERRGERTVVCLAGREPAESVVEPGWKALELVGPFPFDQVGVLASVLGPLADAEVPVFAVSTFETDVVLVKESNTDRAVAALTGARHDVTTVPETDETSG